MSKGGGIVYGGCTTHGRPLPSRLAQHDAPRCPQLRATALFTFRTNNRIVYATRAATRPPRQLACGDCVPSQYAASGGICELARSWHRHARALAPLAQLLTRLPKTSVSRKGAAAVARPLAASSLARSLPHFPHTALSLLQSRGPLTARAPPNWWLTLWLVGPRSQLADARWTAAPGCARLAGA